MRKLFVPDCANEALVVYCYPWANYRIAVNGGWLIFESYDDYKSWKETF